MSLNRVTKQLGTAWPLLIVLTLPGAMPARAGFVASPMELHLADAPGSRNNDTVTITNTGDDVLTMKLYLGDSRQLPQGIEEEVAPGSLNRSLVDWISLHNQVLELQPGESREVTLNLEVPADAEGSYWSKLYMEETSTPSSAKGGRDGRSYSVFMRQRVAVRIFEDVAGTGTLDATIRRVEATGVSEGRPQLSVRVENPGTLIARCKGHIELQDLQGAVLEELPLGTRGEFWVFPGGVRELTAQVEHSLAPGTYTALAVVDFGGEHLVAGDAVITIDTPGAQPPNTIAERD